MTAREGVVSLSLSSHSWLPATDASGNVRSLCDKHVPRVLAHLRQGGEMVTVWQCMVCNACYDVVEVPVS